jgi:hypothetical protein
MAENTKKKGDKIKTQNKVIKLYNYFNAVSICFDLVLGCYYKKLK